MKSHRDIVGDGGSDILGQVGEQKRALNESLGTIGRIVAVGSGKGGVGKSTLTFLLAKALRAEGRSVAILDADLNGPSQARMAGLAGRPWIPVGEKLVIPRRPDGLGVASLGSVVPAADAVGFDTDGSGDEHVWRATREVTLLVQLVTAVEWGDLDVLLVDLPPGPERTAHLVPLFGPRLALLLVTTPSLLSREVVGRARAALEGSSVSILGVVDNMAGYCCPGCDEVRPLFPGREDEIVGPRFGEVPFDPRVAAWLDDGWPDEDPASPTLDAVRVVAKRLIDRLEDAA